MQISQEWLGSFIDNAHTITADEWEKIFVELGIEVENRISSVLFTGPVVIARVEEIEELSGFKKPIRYCQVAVGSGQIAHIICGARNFSRGDMVIAALPGAVLPDNFVITARETYGKISEGMLCSAKELGFLPGKNDEDGIIVLPKEQWSVGTPLTQALNLCDNDEIFELDITPDRGYLLSARSLAREIARKHHLPYKDVILEHSDGEVEKKVSLPKDVVTVTIAPETKVSRFVLQKVVNADPDAGTPWWIRVRLNQAGIRTINLASDITNYVMLELGQPLHAYDADKVGNIWTISLAQPGQTFLTLDGKNRELDTSDVIISDDQQILGLAGVMGGKNSEVSSTTRSVIFEAAIWDPVLVSRTSRRHKLPSEAAKRFARGIDPHLPIQAVHRATELFARYSGGEIVYELTDQIPRGLQEPTQIRFPWVLPEKIIGKPYTHQEIIDTFLSLDCEVVESIDEVIVTVPSWRLDLVQPIDLVEEIIRIQGLDNLPSFMPAASFSLGYTPRQRLQWAIMSFIAAHGGVEVMDPLFISPETLVRWGIAAEDPRMRVVEILNPLEQEKNIVATTLLPGLLTISQRNYDRGNHNFAIFTQAQVAFARNGQIPVVPALRSPSLEIQKAIDAGIPEQEQHVAMMFVGEKIPLTVHASAQKYGYIDAIDMVRSMCRLAHVSETIVQETQYPPFHPGRCARFEIEGKILGYAGQIHPEIAKYYHLPEESAAFEINLDILPLHDKTICRPQVSAYPPVLQDLAVVVDKDIPEQEIRAALQEGAGALLESIHLYDAFSGNQLGKNKKSLTYSLCFRSPERTLTVDEASYARDQAVAEAHCRYGAVIRGPEYHQEIKSQYS